MSLAFATARFLTLAPPLSRWECRLHARCHAISVTNSVRPIDQNSGIHFEIQTVIH